MRFPSTHNIVAELVLPMLRWSVIPPVYTSASMTNMLALALTHCTGRVRHQFVVCLSKEFDEPTMCGYVVYRP